MISRQVTDAVRRYRADVEIVVVPPLCPLNASLHSLVLNGAITAGRE